MAIIQITSLSFLFVTFAMNPLLITCKDIAVVDLQGKPLLSNNSYYIMPKSGDILSGIGLTKAGHIVQLLVTDPRHPVSFIPQITNSNGAVVDESSNHLIQFHSRGDVKTYQWNVDLKDAKTGNYYLSVDMSGKKVKDDWFQIVKSDPEHSYNIMYCLGKSCYPLGAYIVNGEYRLAINDKVSYRPLSFVFSKASRQ
ncbi:hypothetical protein ACFE04_004891 [Oxalis oulophora]